MEQLHDRNETLCYRLLTGHLAGLLPRRLAAGNQVVRSAVVWRPWRGLWAVSRTGCW